MSCEIILFPIIANAVVSAVTAAWLGSALKDRHQIAQQQAEKQQAELDTWQHYRQRQQQRQQQLQAEQQALQAMQQQLAQITLKAPSLSLSQPAVAQASGFVNTEDHQQAVAHLQQISQYLQNLPAELTTATSPLLKLFSPLQRLQQQAAQFQLDAASVNQFQAMVDQTLTHYQQEVQTAAAYQQQAMQRLEQCVLDLLTAQHLATSLAIATPELVALQQQLTTTLAQTTITPGQLQTLVQQTQQQLDQLDQTLSQHLLQQHLVSAIENNLLEMGYQPRQAFTRNGQRQQACFDIPGGEQVAITLHHNNQLACQVQHQRSQADEAPLSAAEQRLLQTQEARWCEDVTHLIARLTQQGFAYEIQFERFYPVAAVPIVVVEDIADIIQATANLEESHEPPYWQTHPPLRHFDDPD